MGQALAQLWDTRPVRVRSVPTGVPDSPVRVLVAHADPGVRRRLREALEHAGYQLLETESVAGAVAACRRESPAVAVVHAGLRAEDGRSALEHLKAERSAWPSCSSSRATWRSTPRWPGCAPGRSPDRRAAAPGRRDRARAR